MIAKCRAVLILLPLFALVGCGGGDKPKLVSVKGKVVHKGQPLTGGTLWFAPDASNSFRGDSPSCKLELDGSFVMQTYPFGDGVPPGKYKVTLGPELANRIKMPQYASVASSPVTLEIPESGLNDTLIEIK